MTSSPAARCPRCLATVNNDWQQCGGACPMPRSPHYTMAAHASQRIAPTSTKRLPPVTHTSTNRVVQGTFVDYENCGLVR